MTCKAFLGAENSELWRIIRLREFGRGNGYFHYIERGSHTLNPRNQYRQTVSYNREQINLQVYNETPLAINLSFKKRAFPGPSVVRPWSIEDTLEAAKNTIHSRNEYYFILEPGHSVIVINNDLNPRLFVGDLMTWSLASDSAKHLCDQYIREYIAYNTTGEHKPILPNIPSVCGAWVIRKNKQVLNQHDQKVQTFHIKPKRNVHSMPESKLHTTGYGMKSKMRTHARVCDYPNNCVWLKDVSEGFPIYWDDDMVIPSRASAYPHGN